LTAQINEEEQNNARTEKRSSCVWLAAVDSLK